MSNIIQMLSFYAFVEGTIPSSLLVLKLYTTIITPSMSYTAIIVINFVKWVLKIVNLWVDSIMVFGAPISKGISTGVNFLIGL